MCVCVCMREMRDFRFNLWKVQESMQFSRILWGDTWVNIGAALIINNEWMKTEWMNKETNKWISKWKTEVPPRINRNNILYFSTQVVSQLLHWGKYVYGKWKRPIWPWYGGPDQKPAQISLSPSFQNDLRLTEWLVISFL